MRLITYWSATCLAASLLVVCIAAEAQTKKRPFLVRDARIVTSAQGAFAPLWRIPLKNRKPHYKSGLVSGDWNGDGSSDILVRTQTGVLVLDANGKKQTTFPMGEQIEFLALGRTPQGPLLLGFSTWGKTIEAYDRQGKRRWTYRSTDGVDWAATVDIHDPKGDGVAVGYNGGVILLLDAAGRVIWRVESNSNAWSVAGAQLSKDAPSSILSVAEGIPIYNAKGTLVQEFKPCDAGAVYGADLDGDGVDEVLGLGNTGVSGHYLWVFDANGTLRWRRKAPTRYATLEGPFAVGRFGSSGVEIAIGHSDGTIFRFGKQGTLLPGLKVTPDLRAFCTLRQSKGQDAVLARTSRELICYTWQKDKVSRNPVFPAQDKKEKDIPESPFVRAVQHNALAQVQTILEKGGDPNEKNSQGSPVLIVAAHRGHTATVQLLLEKGADINARRKDGLSALMVAINDKHSEVARLLVEKGAVVNTVYKTQGFELTALVIAVISSHTEIVEALLKAGAKPDLPDTTPLERTPLFWTDKVEIARLLIAHGATVDARDTMGQTPLMNAVRESNVDMLKFLITNGANVNAREDHTRHLYFIARFGGDAKMQRKIEQSGRLKVRREDGISVLELALGLPKRAVTSEIIEMLKKAGAKEPSVRP